MRTCRPVFALLVIMCLANLASAQQTISCNSDDGKKHYCQAETRAGVHMVKQRSGLPCTQGVSWDFDNQGVWVDKGCRADFLLAGNSGANRSGVPLTCSSNDGGRQHCPADTHGGVEMVKQISGSACVEGRTWGFDQSGVWVDKGCRANFLLGGNGAGRRDSGAPGRTCMEALGAQRAKQLVQQCLQVSPATHPPCNAQNSCKLITDEIKRSCQLLDHNAPGFCNEYR